jgi:hypothetical protein
MLLARIVHSNDGNLEHAAVLPVSLVIRESTASPT